MNRNRHKYHCRGCGFIYCYDCTDGPKRYLPTKWKEQLREEGNNDIQYSDNNREPTSTVTTEEGGGTVTTTTGGTVKGGTRGEGEASSSPTSSFISSKHTFESDCNYNEPQRCCTECSNALAVQIQNNHLVETI